MNRNHKKILLYSFLLLIFAVSFFQYQHRAPKRNFCDFHVPYTIGKKILTGEEIYSFEKGLSYFKYTPFYANLMVPLSHLSEKSAANIWYILNLLFLMVLFHSSRRIIISDAEDYNPFMLYLLTSIVSFRFILQNMHEGQANIFMLTLLVCGLFSYFHQKEIKGAFFVAYSIMTKYMTVLFLPYFIVRKRFKFLLSVIAFILFFNFLPALAFGLHKNIKLITEQLNFLFASSLDNYSITCYPNQSLLSCIARFFWKESVYPIQIVELDTVWVWAIFSLIALILYTLAVYPIFREPSKYDPGDLRWKYSLDWALIFICVALFNPNGWKNFFVFLIFPYMVLIHYLLKVKFKDKVITPLFIVSFILTSLTSEFFVYDWAGDNFELYSSITFGSLILFAALLILKVKT